MNSFINDVEQILPKRITDHTTTAIGEVAKDVFAAVAFLLQAQNNQTYFELTVPLGKVINESSLNSLFLSKNITNVTAFDVLQTTTFVIKNPRVSFISVLLFTDSSYTLYVYRNS